MKGMMCLAGLLVLGLAGCSTPSASGDQKLTVDECRSYFEYTYQLDGMDAAQMLGAEQIFMVDDHPYRLAYAQKIRFGLVVSFISCQRALIRMLRGQTPTFGCFDDDGFDETAVEAHLAKLTEGAEIARPGEGLDPALIRAVIHAESSFRPAIVSRKGAVGLMQLMPQTAAFLGVQDASHPEQNIIAGSRYLAQLLKQHNSDLALALAAYNAGASNVKRYGGIPPFAETQAYVQRVTILHKRYQQQG